ncbi:MAG: transcription antitermination factor NusB [Thermodesulfobacterium sp.]|jgi:N utilization substance protein B|nr:transcription antitermination factor NusB [Thermodesulfobacterium sp.]
MTRRKGREIALQVLYQIEMSNLSAKEALAQYRNHFIEASSDEEEASSFEDVKDLEEAFNFASDLVLGIEKNRNFIDEKIKEYTRNWSFDRLNSTDKNILRIAIFEMFFRPDIPEVVSINEAVELAKLYGTDDSPSFVNGILDSIYKKELLSDKKED